MMMPAPTHIDPNRLGLPRGAEERGRGGHRGRGRRRGHGRRVAARCEGRRVGLAEDLLRPLRKAEALELVAELGAALVPRAVPEERMDELLRGLLVHAHHAVARHEGLRRAPGALRHDGVRADDVPAGLPYDGRVDLGWHHSSNATCLIRSHLFSAAMLV